MLCPNCLRPIYKFNVAFIGVRWYHDDDTPLCRQATLEVVNAHS